MRRKNTITRAGIIAALALSIHTANAQDIHFTQFQAAPLTVNPAFTGDFDGQYRVAAIYRNQWASVTTPYKTYGVSFDMPVIHDLSIDDYLAVGGQLFNDVAGDGNLSNFSGLLSVAYQKFLGAKQDKALSVGIQGGYSERSVDFSKLYFGDEFANGSFNPGTSLEYQTGLNNRVHYFTVNAGISFAHQVSSNFGYQLGVGANNLNQPADGFEVKQNSQVAASVAMRYNAQLGAIWFLSERFSLRPAAIYQSQATATEIIAGNEFNVIVGNDEVRSFATNVFVGAWYRPNDAVMATAGIEFKGFRIGVGYDYNTSDLKTASNGNGGFEIALTYKAPNPIDFAHRIVYPCARF